MPSMQFLHYTNTEKQTLRNKSCFEMKTFDCDGGIDYKGNEKN